MESDTELLLQVKLIGVNHCCLVGYQLVGGSHITGLFGPVHQIRLLIAASRDHLGAVHGT